jgi:hypothetical protein
MACGLTAPAAAPTQPGLETIVAATLQAMTSNAPAQTATVEATLTDAPPNGISIAFGNVSFIIPDKLASGAASEQMPAISSDNGAPWEVGPAYIKFTLSSYPLQETMWKPEIRIYPVEEFLQTVPVVTDNINTLQDILANPANSLPKNLPFLPYVNAAQDFYAQMQVVNFQNGSGIRYLTQFDQAPIPINNQEMFYTFQGLTSNGRYYISATLPVNAAFLPVDGNINSPTPRDGVPMDWNNFENWPIYLDAVTQKIGAADPNAFQPSLPMLDALIQSIFIAP